MTESLDAFLKILVPGIASILLSAGVVVVRQLLKRWNIEDTNREIDSQIRRIEEEDASGIAPRPGPVKLSEVVRRIAEGRGLTLADARERVLGRLAQNGVGARVKPKTWPEVAGRASAAPLSEN